MPTEQKYGEARDQDLSMRMNSMSLLLSKLCGEREKGRREASEECDPDPADTHEHT